MLYKVFVDDSGAKDYVTPYSRDFVVSAPAFEGNEAFWRENYFVLCGVRVKQSDIADLDSQIKQLKTDCFGTHNVEIKSTWLRIPDKRKKHYLDPYNITAEELNQFGEAIIDLVARNSATLKVFGVVFDKRYYGDAKRLTGDGNPLLKSTQVLMEKIDMSGKMNVVTFDQFESSLSVEKGNHRKMMGIYNNNDGVETVFTEEYGNITDIDFKKSCDENFLQIADVCAYNIHRQFMIFGREWCGEKKGEDGKQLLGTYDYFDRMRCNLYADGDGIVRGRGLTCIPTVNKVNWDFHKNCPA